MTSDSSRHSSARRSERTQHRTPPAPAAARFDARDAIAIAAILVFALLMMLHAGSRRGEELMPWPDGLEYAAMAVNLNRGLGPVLHFGGYSYPSRYTAGYPLLLAAVVPRVVGVAHAYCVTIVLGLAAIALIFAITWRIFGRAAAPVAALVMACSPVFITYSTLVMSDVPATLFAMGAGWLLILASATAERTPIRSRAVILLAAVFGFVFGYSIAIRPTDAVMVVGIVLALAIVPPAREKLRAFAGPVVAFAAAGALPLLWLARNNAVYLGGALRSGYAWWVGEVYRAHGATFSLAYLFGPTMPRNPHGNLPIYLTALFGVDGMLGNRGDTRFFLYPCAAAIFAIIGIVAVLRTRTRDNRAARRLVLFGLGFLAAITALYSVYLFTDVVFILPGAFVLFICTGAGVVAANRWMRAGLGADEPSRARQVGALAVILLDAAIVFSLGTEVIARLEAPPLASSMVAALGEAASHLPRGSTVASNISLQFLDLRLPDARRNFIALNSLDPGERFTDYHLHRLYDKRAHGWTGPIPMTLFPTDSISAAAEKLIATSARTRAGAYLLLCAPESRAYATVLRQEIAKIDAVFTLTPLIEDSSIALFRLEPR